MADDPRWRIDLPPAKFRALGHELVDQLAAFLASIANARCRHRRFRTTSAGCCATSRCATRAQRPTSCSARRPTRSPRQAASPAHPRWWGYICGSGAPLGVLGDFLASAVNQNVSGWVISALAHEMEAQAIRWTADLLSYPMSCGGLFVTGGNGANFIAFLAARRRQMGLVVRTDGVDPAGWRVYASTECHTWLQKATDMYGLGTNAVTWIPTDRAQRMDVDALRAAMQRDLQAGKRPLLVIGTAGTTSTGAIDPLRAIRDVCREHGAWFHVDGSYGAMAAVLAEPPLEYAALRDADSPQHRHQRLVAGNRRANSGVGDHTGQVNIHGCFEYGCVEPAAGPCSGPCRPKPVA